MIKNGKYFLPPPDDGSDFKALFQRMATAGAGRSVDDDGFPIGAWTPETLAAAISDIDANHGGIELRTVQLWFQDNDKGISTDNIRWLARIFGCDDLEATSDWQLALGTSQTLLTARRRDRKRADGGGRMISSSADTKPHEAGKVTDLDAVAQKLKRRASLASRSEAIFSRGSPLDLPATVFAGSVALGFFSYLTGIHNVFYERADGVTKQVGFIWAPNWTLLFMVFMPVFFACAVELVAFWKDEGRLKFVGEANRAESDASWMRSVEASSFTYWAVFLICLGFAGLFQWIGVRLLPLLDGGGDYAIDWGSLAIVRPEVISVPAAIAFTGAAYLYMCLTFYLMFAGLILLYTVAFDFVKVGHDRRSKTGLDLQDEYNEVGGRIMKAIFRCTLAGIMIAMCMKLQSFYLTSNSPNVVAWLAGDMATVFYGRENVTDAIDYSMPTHYTSLIIAMATCAPFLYGAYRLGIKSSFGSLLVRMSSVVILVAVSYLLIGSMPGFSILLSFGVAVGVYGLFDPAFGSGRYVGLGGNSNVS